MASTSPSFSSYQHILDFICQLPPLDKNTAREGAYDSLREVVRMKSREQTSVVIDSWIAQEELPPSAALKVVRVNDPDYGLTEDEIMDRNEFIRCYLLKDFDVLMMIPRQSPETDFFVPDCTVKEEEYSAFNTRDFERKMRPFNKYAYAMKKILERVEDLAILHSSLNSVEARERCYQRYQGLIELEFRDRLLGLVRRYQETSDEEKRFGLKQKIAEINRRILDCRRIWERYAPWDT
jgi:hypothetical protein